MLPAPPDFLRIVRSLQLARLLYALSSAFVWHYQLPRTCPGAVCGSVAQEGNMWVVRAAPDHLVVPKIASIGIKYYFQRFLSCQFTLTVSP